MDNRENEIVDGAVRWQQAIVRDDMDWNGFTAWLEADPRHRAAFDDLALIDAAIDRHRPAIRAILPADDGAEPQIGRRGTGRRWFIGGGIAAAIALAVGTPLLYAPGPDATLYASRAGETRTIALTDGSQLALSADSAVSVSASQRQIEVTRGAAYFDVPHDPARQLAVTVGDYRITDIGTRFAVDTDGARVSIAVAEGKVAVTPPNGSAVALAAGQRLDATGDSPPEVTPIAPAAVASWRQGRLVYDNTPLTAVTHDISRYTGSRVDLAPGLDNRRFSGVLVIGDGSHLVSDLAAVAGLAVERDGARIVLDPRS